MNSTHSTDCSFTQKACLLIVCCFLILCPTVTSGQIGERRRGMGQRSNPLDSLTLWQLQVNHYPDYPEASTGSRDSEVVITANGLAWDSFCLLSPFFGSERLPDLSLPTRLLFLFYDPRKQASSGRLWGRWLQRELDFLDEEKKTLGNHTNPCTHAESSE